MSRRVLQRLFMLPTRPATPHHFMQAHVLKTVAVERNIGPLRLRNSTILSPHSMDDSERTTRSYFNTKSKSQPRAQIQVER